MNRPRYCPDCSGHLVYELNLAKCEFGCGKVWDVSVLSATPRDKGLAREKKLRVVFTLAGAIIGLMIVRSFMFDQIEELGWRMFWDAFLHGRLGERDMGMVFQSATFMKSLVGLILGGVLGLSIARKQFSSSGTGGRQ